MIILGIDPGTTRVGYGFIETDGGVSLIDCGIINSESKAPGDRLTYIGKELKGLITSHKPDLISLET